MKTTSIFSSALLLITLSFTTLAQKTEFQVPQMPVDKGTGLISYSEEIPATGIKKAELYKWALNWFNAHYKNPTDVIREQNPEGGKIVGKARFKIYNEDKKGFKTDAGIVMYTITLQVEDGKYKYTITDINWKQPSFYGIEKWMDKNSKLWVKMYDYYLFQTDEEIRKEVITTLKNALKVPGK